MKCTDDLGYLLNKAARLSKLKVNQKLSEIGLTFPQFLVVKHLGRNDQAESELLCRTPASIAEHLGYDRPTITGIIDRLVKQGFVLRETNPADRRSQTITLTQKSHDLIEKMDNCFKEVNNQALTGFQMFEQKAFKDYLLRLIDNFDEQKEGPEPVI
jgi:DNA-binding MarR family transcriptional regulator